MTNFRFLSALSVLAFAVTVTPGASRVVSRADAAPTPALAEPSLSPDASEIAFVSGGDIWTVPAEGGTARLLISHEATESRPLYSPDGTQLAFVSDRTGNGDIYVLTLASGDLRRITFDDQSEELDSWSRDGAWLFFSSSRGDISGMADEYRVSTSGGTPMPIAGDRYASEYWGAPSPDGNVLAVTARGVSRSQWWRKGHSHLDESEIDLVTWVDGSPRYRVLVPEGGKNGWPMWSTDGKTLFFISDRDGAANIWSTSAENGNPVRLTNFTDGRVLWPSISANGHAIVFERNFGIWRYDIASKKAARVEVALRGAPAGSGLEELALGDEINDFVLSPDGKKVAFTAHGELFAAGTKEGGRAARVTHTPELEQQPAWSPDSRKLVYASNRDGEWQLYLYDFGDRTERQLTHEGRGNVSPIWSPDGKHIAWVRAGREIRIMNPDGSGDRLLARALLGNPPFVGSRDFAFSPDSRWLAYLAPGGTRSFTNAMAVPVEGGTPRPLSFLANSNGRSLAWGGDGKSLYLLSAQRTETAQLARIDLVPKTPRFREDQFRDLFREESPRPPSPAQPRERRNRDSDSSATRANADSGSRSREPSRTEIVFDGIRQRLSMLPVEVSVNDITVSPDGKQALLTAGAAGQTNLYVYSLDELSGERAAARQLTSTAAPKRSAQWSPDGKQVYYLERGRINSVNVESRAVKPLSVQAEIEVDFADEKVEVLNEAWSYLRDNFFDSTMNGVDWNAVHARYTELIKAARTRDEMRRLLSLMVGELNSSHSGIGSRSRQSPYTGRLGLEFDPAEYWKSGRLRVSKVIPLSPADIAGIASGSFLVSVNGATIDRTTNLNELLAHTIDHRTVLGIIPPNERSVKDVAVLPVSSGTEKGLLYRAWVEERRAYVEKASGGRLGYVHMFNMSQDALSQLYQDLDVQNMKREGIVIDVRNNNGGFVNPYAIDVLARRGYLTMVGRGEPAVPARSQLGQRSLELPTVLVVNQHTLSDGEDFTEGYRTLGLGKVVGEPTAGWIVFTSGATLIDGTTVRLPSTRVLGSDMKDMELHPRPVDVAVLRPVGESYSGKDSQLDAAVKQLLGQLGGAAKTSDGGDSQR